jgi:hypothetical protein
MSNVNPEEIAKLICVRTLLGRRGQADEYLDREIKQAIEWHLSGDPKEPASLDSFIKAVSKLCAENNTPSVSFGYHHLRVTKELVQPLWFHTELIRGFKILSGYQEALYIISGLRACCTQTAHGTTHFDDTRFTAINDLVCELALRWKTANCQLRLLIT